MATESGGGRGEGGAERGEGGLSPRRIAELRHRIASGFYSTLWLADELARRIFASGDLGPPRSRGDRDRRTSR